MHSEWNRWSRWSQQMEQSRGAFSGHYSIYNDVPYEPVGCTLPIRVNAAVSEKEPFFSLSMIPPKINAANVAVGALRTEPESFPRTID